MAKIKNKGKKNLSDRVKEKAPKSKNPFEVHVNRQKFSVIGRKLKHDKGLPGVARSKAFKKRKATLLHEYQLKNKSNRFMDRRIGEKNRFMSEEDKLTARFTAEKMRAHKKSIYNLADDEILTHRGHVLSEIEKFDDPKSDDEEDEKGKLEAKFVTEAHFGGFLTKKEETEGQAKSRKDLIDQLIAESKKRRYEKQKMQDETLELTDKLDTQWKDLLPLVSFGNSEPVAAQESTSDSKNVSNTNERKKVDPYDVAVQELKFEARGMPSEKLKTEEEIAKEEKEKLEKLESERQRRMHGLLDDPAKCHKHKSADDLDDGLVLESDIEEDEDMNDRNTETEKNMYDSDEKESNEDEDLDSEEERGSDDNEDSEQSEDSGDNTDDDLSDLVLRSSDDENLGEELQNLENKKEKTLSSREVTKKKKSLTKISKPNTMEDIDQKMESVTSEEKQKDEKVDDDSSNTNDEDEDKKSSDKIRSELLQRKKIMDTARKELPYTFQVPETSDGFTEIMKGLGPEHQSVVLERMIKCTHPSLKSGNKECLERLFGLLIQHLYDSAWVSESQRKFSDQPPMSQPAYCFAVLGSIIPHLYDLAQSSPENAAYCISEVLKEKFSDVGKEYPGVDTLVFLRMIPQLFPTSDFRHSVSTPAIIFMTHILRSGKVKTRRDIATGLFITTILLECTSLSKRFSPEAVNFLRGILYMAIPKAKGLPIPPSPPTPFKSISDESNLLVILKDPFRGCEEIPELIMNADDLDGDIKKIDNSFKVRALFVASQLIVNFIKQLQDIPSSKEIFGPFVNLIPLLPLAVYPKSLAESITILESDLNELMNDSTPLEKLAHAAKKPKPLRLYEPAIIDIFDGQKRRTVSKERSEREKLLHKYKKEMKGAIREIRRDKDFLAKVKVKETIRNDIQRIEKVKEIFGTAAIQQGEIRKLKRKK